MRPGADSPRGVSQDEWVRLRQETIQFLVELETAFINLQGEIGEHRGEDGVSKTDLVRRLGMCFYYAFGRLPTVAPSGPFISAIKAIVDKLHQFGKKDVRIGKDIIAAGIRPLKFMLLPPS
jgi:hypothetical protein